MSKIKKPFHCSSFDARRRILIGASTGGVDALILVLSEFPEDCPPTIIVQHTGKDFVQGLSQLLDQKTKAQVQVASSYQSVIAGNIYIAPGGDHHLVLTGSTGSRLKALGQSPDCGHRPTVDRLFGSAVPIAPFISAAILTGMGADGARGLKQLRDAGARTFGQNRATSTVYGMPRAAMELGAVERELPISQMARALLKSCYATS